MDKKEIGRWGEDQAAKYLRKKRYRIVGRNFSCRFGEIDLIAEDREFIVFVEVKTRKSDAFATAREFVTGAKQERLRATAQLWLQQNPTKKQPRFDVIEVYGDNGAVAAIEHIENAF